MLGALGRMAEEVASFTDFAIRTIVAVLSVPFRRPGALFHQFERVALGALPIVMVAGASVGLVTWFQTHRLLAKYGIESTLPSVLAVAVMLETGPMLAALLVAGKMGAGFGAELGSMVLTEEVDALAVMGAAPVPTLVAPRVLACALTLPLLTVILDASAIVGGLVAEEAAGGLNAQSFWIKSLLFLRLADVVPATLKTAVFGFVVGLVGCWTGLKADRSAESVGKAATLGVVRSMAAVFIANVMIVPWIQAGVAALGWKS